MILMLMEYINRETIFRHNLLVLLPKRRIIIIICAQAIHSNV